MAMQPQPSPVEVKITGNPPVGPYSVTVLGQPGSKHTEFEAAISAVYAAFRIDRLEK